MLMTAKMNFTGKVVGDHPHLLRFLGGVVSDSQSMYKWLSSTVAKLTLNPYSTSWTILKCHKRTA